MQVKKIEIRDRVASVSIELPFGHQNSQSKVTDIEDLKAIYILMGGYNEYGRHIPVEQFHGMQEDFKVLVWKIKQFKK
jgi:hypothetical protein